MKNISTKLMCGAALFISVSLTIPAFAQVPAIYEPSLLPSNPQVGHCYARVLIPAQYSSTPETVLTQDAYETIKIVQVQLESRTEQVETKEASVRYEVRQPTFKSVTKRMMVRPAYERLSVSRPQFKTIRETIASSAPRRVWKLGNPGALAARGYRVISTADAGRGGRGYRSTVDYGAQRGGATHCGSGCEIWCLVEEPGESVSFNRKVMVTPGTVRRNAVPAKYTSITKQVVADPGGVREIAVPAQYRSIVVEHISAPSRQSTVSVPAQYGRVNKKTLTAGERYEWREVVCDPAKGRASAYNSSSLANTRRTTYSNYGGAASSRVVQQPYVSPAVSPASTSTTTSYRARSRSSGTVYTNVPSSNYGHPQVSTPTITTPTPTGTYYYGTNKPVYSSGHSSAPQKMNNPYKNK